MWGPFMLRLAIESHAVCFSPCGHISLIIHSDATELVKNMLRLVGVVERRWQNGTIGRNS